MKSKIFALVIFFLWVVPTFAQVGTAWVRRYNGPGNGTDWAYAIAVDGSGNVYVTGESYGSGTSDDYVTIKYDPQGTQLWIREYNGPGNTTDNAFAIAVDSSGNVYVTGRSVGSGTNYDCATIKYYPDGDTAWVRRYNGPGNSYDYANAIAVDGSGNVYVTGGSNGGGTSDDYATIKYDRQGNQLWVSRYNGPGNSDDAASAIAVDGSGNVYVTGRSVGSGTSQDYATIKYYPSGDTAWVRRYSGPGGSWDDAFAIVADGSGNAYVTGPSGTIRYDADGNQLWFGSWGGFDITLDDSNNSYVTGSSAGDYATIKYYANGDTCWVRRYNGPVNSYDAAYGIAVDDSGNVYVTGDSYGSGTYDDYATIKYDPQGNQLWVRRYNGPGNFDDGANAIALDGSGNVYVTGYSYGSGTDNDYATIKYVQFLCGDANDDGVVDVGDVVDLINYLFKNGPAPDPLQAGDANLDTVVDVGDVVYLINYLFKGGPPPCE